MANENPTPHLLVKSCCHSGRTLNGLAHDPGWILRCLRLQLDANGWIADPSRMCARFDMKTSMESGDHHHGVLHWTEGQTTAAHPSGSSPPPLSFWSPPSSLERLPVGASAALKTPARPAAICGGSGLIEPDPDSFLAGPIIASGGSLCALGWCAWQVSSAGPGRSPGAGLLRSKSAVLHTNWTSPWGISTG